MMDDVSAARAARDVRLRELRLDDWATIHQWCEREDVTQYQVWGPNSPAETHRYVEDAVAASRTRPRTWHVMTAVVDDTVVGLTEITLRSPGSRVAEFGYAVHPRFWRQGIGTRIAHLSLNHAFGPLCLHRVEARVDATNIASVRLLQSVGMRLEGTLRQDVWLGTRWRDSHVFASLEREWTLPVDAAQPRGNDPATGSS